MARWVGRFKREKSPQERRIKPKKKIEDTHMRLCMNPACDEETIHAKGLCYLCYIDTLKRIKKGETFFGGPYDGFRVTWDRLEKMGLCRQKRRQMKRPWN